MNREDALKKSDEALQELAEALKQGKSESLIRYLDMMSSFHHYSFCNCMLIALQKPDASYVAGFHRWKALGRHVIKGEAGIAILTPIAVRRKKKADDSKPDDEEHHDPKSTGVLGFRTVYVFDVSQTEGADMPEFARLQGDPGEKLLKLEEIVRSHEITIEFVDSLPGDANGMSEGGKISINSNRSNAQMFSTMTHELAHELLHWKEDRRESTSKSIRETEAEAVAYVVCRWAGLECSTKASDYIQLWNGDEKVLIQSMELIRTVSAKIIAELESMNIESEEVAHVAS